MVDDYSYAKSQSDAQYEQAQMAAASRKALSSDEEVELKTLWKKLFRLFHPDRFADQPDKLETYHHLTSAINQARENGDIARLREIADDPHGFILRQGWVSLDFKDETELKNLRRLFDTLQLEIVTTLDSINALHESAEFELCQMCEKKPSLLAEVAAEQVEMIAADTPVARPSAKWCRFRSSLHPFSTNCGCPRVAAFGQRKKFCGRGSIKLPFSRQQINHIADIGDWQL